MIDACRKYEIHRYPQVNAYKVYGDLPLDRQCLFFTEDTPIDTNSPYSSLKIITELMNLLQQSSVVLTTMVHIIS